MTAVVDQTSPSYHKEHECKGKETSMPVREANWVIGRKRIAEASETDLEWKRRGGGGKRMGRES